MPTSDKKTYAPLHDEMRDWLISEVQRTAKAIRDLKLPPKVRRQPQVGHAAWLEKLLDNLLWFWSVDRVREGGVVRDAIAQKGGNGGPFELASFTHKARAVHRGRASKLIVREHVVPKAEIIRLLLDPSTDLTSSQTVGALLQRYCFVAYVHKTQDAALRKKRLKSCMPKGWSTSAPLLERDPWARYRKVPRLIEDVVRHGDAPPI